MKFPVTDDCVLDRQCVGRQKLLYRHRIHIRWRACSAFPRTIGGHALLSWSRGVAVASLILSGLVLRYNPSRKSIQEFEDSLVKAYVVGTPDYMLDASAYTYDLLWIIEESPKQ
ncbi:hypothetical protein SeLEV6574_g06648 [Synchytrium endobioticum]|uniref:Uncharacterized protein n=1 Tax=Synchytrium endobioticum TaxID=286115 RepID=A0A507CL38_9FUNG|nr:hypothetical protein SeLEV6574_g06648 [Synchytrium endobioticum]